MERGGKLAEVRAVAVGLHGVLQLSQLLDDMSLMDISPQSPTLDKAVVKSNHFSGGARLRCGGLRAARWWWGNVLSPPRATLERRKVPTNAVTVFITRGNHRWKKALNTFWWRVYVTPARWAETHLSQRNNLPSNMRSLLSFRWLEANVLQSSWPPRRPWEPPWWFKTRKLYWHAFAFTNPGEEKVTGNNDNVFHCDQKCPPPPS